MLRSCTLNTEPEFSTLKGDFGGERGSGYAEVQLQRRTGWIGNGKKEECFGKLKTSSAMVSQGLQVSRREPHQELIR